MFSIDDFAKLQFLTGRWQGHSKEGKELYEEYERLDPATFRSHNYSSAAFIDPTDGSTIVFKDGEVISTWGELSWRATEIHDDSAVFEPINAPSQFSWHRVGATGLEARQRWTADGKEQEYTIRFSRVMG